LWFAHFALVSRILSSRQVFVNHVADRRSFYHVMSNFSTRIEGETHKVFPRVTDHRSWFSRSTVRQMNHTALTFDTAHLRILPAPLATAETRSLLVYRNRVEKLVTPLPGNPLEAKAAAASRTAVPRQEFPQLHTMAMAHAIPAGSRQSPPVEPGTHAKPGPAERRQPEESRPRAISLPDHELDRIAERVIGNIDRRIIADRERLGRI
jgi:hypothetical protein